MAYALCKKLSSHADARSEKGARRSADAHFETHSLEESAKPIKHVRKPQKGEVWGNHQGGAPTLPAPQSLQPFHRGPWGLSRGRAAVTLLQLEVATFTCLLWKRNKKKTAL